MPLVGLGLWKMDKDVCAETVYQAIKIGYRLLDSACDYGNEQEVGQGIKRALQEGIVKREDLFIVSKLWNTFHRPENVRSGLLRTLKDLQLEYVDLYLIHFPIAMLYVDPEVRYPPEWIHDPAGTNRIEPDMGVSYEQTWHAVEALQEEGLTKAIGSCNIHCAQLLDVMRFSKIKPAVLQVELHPYLT